MDELAFHITGKGCPVGDIYSLVAVFGDMSEWMLFGVAGIAEGYVIWFVIYMEA